MTGVQTCALPISFQNLQTDDYWSSNSALAGAHAWSVNFEGGSQGRHLKSFEYFAWAVRDGDVIPTIDTILEYFYAGVEDETINGRGRRPWRANARLWIFGQML